MPRLMYDSVNATAIPTSALIVAGYVDGEFRWTDADWARFPNAVKVRIAVSAQTNDGHVCDVETFDLTPGESVSWVRMRRASGIDPSVYCNLSTLPLVQEAFARANEPLPWFWIAAYSVPPSLSLAPRQVAHQYIDPPGSGGNYDLSIVADKWPGIDKRATAPMTISAARPDGGTDHYTLCDDHLEHTVTDFGGNLVWHDTLPGSWSALIDCGYRGSTPYVQGHGTDVGHSSWEVTYSDGWKMTPKP